MHRMLARQLRRACGVEAPAALPALVAEMAGLAGSGGVSPGLAALVSGLPELLGHVDRAYEQYERDLELRYRSLELSSSELIHANERIRQELAGRDRILESLRQAASALLGRDAPIEAPVEADLEALAALLPQLAEQQEASRRELDSLRFAIDQHAIVSVTDTDGRILSVNDKFCRISGYSRSELLGQNHRVINSGFHPRSFFENMWSTISQGRVWHGEICNRSKGGNIYWVEATIVPFLDARGAPIRYIAVRTEITAIKEMQQAQSAALAELRQLNELLAGRERELRVSEARNRALVENLLEGLVVFTPDFVIEDLNPAAERMHGYRREELMGRPLSVLLPEDELKEGRNFLEKNTPDSLNRATEKRARRKNGEVFPIELQLYKVDTPTGYLLVAHVRDLSERHEVDRLKRQFVSTVSHELRTPLTALRGSLGLLALGVLGDLPDAARDVVSIAERNTTRLVGLINDILDLERIQAGQLALEKRPTPLGTVLQHARDTVDALARESAIAIEVPDVDHIVLGDGDRLVQVIVNLLSNAIKFSPPASPVRIQARREGQVVRISVIDAGRGVALEHRQAIFEPFRQAESSDARLKGGSGLGLSISRAIVEQHGGSIGVEPHDGPGATFWFTVPVAGVEATG